jgi:hypothetical protein
VLASRTTDHRTLREVLGHLIAVAREQEARIAALEGRAANSSKPRVGVDGAQYLGLPDGE